MENRRDFLKKVFVGTGSLVLGFEVFTEASVRNLKNATEASLYNAYLTITSAGKITIFSPNPEIGQGIKTAFSVVVAEELDVSITSVEVVQAHFDPKRFDRQETGGSAALRHSWERLRKAGASARYALLEAAAKKWGVEVTTLKTNNGKVINAEGKTFTYGELVEEATKIQIPDKVPLKAIDSFTQIGKSIKGVDNIDVITGKAIYGIDYYEEGMVYAQLVRPPFGKKLKQFDATEAKKIDGIIDVIAVGNKVAIIGKGNWEIIKARQLLKVEWMADKQIEDDQLHNTRFDEIMKNGKFDVKRRDGDVEKAFQESFQIVEATYQCPFLPHNPMEPMNFFADARNLEKVKLVGSTQNPGRTLPYVTKLLNTTPENVRTELTKMGGSFGRRISHDFTVEAAELSHIIKKPVKLNWTREDDMTGGCYRPAVRYKFKVGLDKMGNIIAYSLKGIGMNWNSVVRENIFPAGAIENVLIENYDLKSDVTTGYWRAPVTNFLAFAEQAFLDEVASKAGKDPIAMRLELLKKVKEKPIGNTAYEPQRFEEVIKKVAERANWGKVKKGVYQGFSVYFSHNSYVAQVAEVITVKGKTKLKKVYVVADCGIVVNMSGAKNQVYGSVIDGVGHALHGKLSFKDGVVQENNFNQFRLIKFDEVPEIDVYFIDNGKNPTGLGEPALPPVGGALANAYAKATQKRLYQQPFAEQMGNIY
ncbi:MAG: molybdopterin-dependent oxidoreductase [Arcicella sp.]|jgi:isoquinoline 1-oxidoreductase beta subunit|nr:molybdopterin-dependent oxidoreductase [Arcicella sp.]